MSPAASAFGLLAAMPGFEELQSALRPEGPQAEHIGNLWWLILYVCVAVYLLVIAALLWGFFRSRRREVTSPDPHPEPRRERRLTVVVAFAAGLTVVILLFLTGASFFTDQALAKLSHENSVNIEVIGHQWWWEVKYQDPTPSRSFTTANEIHIPVGRTVALTLKSQDVIHSFWVPNLNGKKDLIPGHTGTLYLRADTAGVYRGQCAEFCGYQHAKMAFLVVAEPPEKFNAWAEQQRQPASPPTDPLRQRGLQVFLSSTCVMCHTIQGTQAAANQAPSLTHVAGRMTLAAGTLPNTRGYLAGWVVDSQRIKPGNRMPPNPMAPEDLQALLAYLGGLK